MSRKPLPRWLKLFLFGVVCFAVAACTIKLTRFHGGVALVFVANAILLARLLTSRGEHWPAYLCVAAVAGIAATSLFGLGPYAALPMAAVNLGEVVLAAVLIRNASPERKLGSQAPLRWFLLAAGFVAPTVSAFGGAAIATVFGADTYWNNWLNWFTGHALGAMTFTPISVYLFRGDARAWVRVARPAAALEAVALALLVTVICVLVFAQSLLPLLFLPLLPIILATFRIGRLGAAVSIVLLTTIGGILTARGNGPIALIHGPASLHVQFLQFYLACTVLTVLPVAAELARRGALYRRLHDSEARYRLLTENSTDIMLNLDVDGQIRYASPAIRQIGGFDPADVVGRDAGSLVAPEDMPRVQPAHLEALADPSRTVIVEYRAPTATGELRWFETHTRAVLDDAGQVTGVVSAVRDVGHRKNVEQRLAHAAMTDRLTGIANRRAFDSQLEQAIANAGVDGFGCVALFDIDHFKHVNDQYGHAAGDAVLRAFADLARGRLRDVDYLARFGGEEFAVILPGAAPEQARLVCDRLRTAVAETAIMVNAGGVRITLSGGVARYDGSTPPDQVLAAADAALYDAKRSGRDRLALAA